MQWKSGQLLLSVQQEARTYASPKCNFVNSPPAPSPFPTNTPRQPPHSLCLCGPTTHSDARPTPRLRVFFCLFVFLCIDREVCLHAHICTLTYWCPHRDQRSTSEGVFLYCSSPCTLKWDCSLILELTVTASLVAAETLASSCVCAQSWGCRLLPLCTVFV